MEQKELLSIAFKMTISLGVVLLVFAVAIYFLRKFTQNPVNLFKKSAAQKIKKPLEVLAYQSLGPAKGLYLIRCLDKKILVGASNASIQHLSDIVDEEDSVDDVDESSISKHFQSTLEKRSNPETQGFERGLKEIARV